MTDFSSLPSLAARQDDDEIAVAGWQSRTGTIQLRTNGELLGATYPVGTQLRVNGTVYTVNRRVGQQAYINPWPSSPISNVASWEVYWTGRIALHRAAPTQLRPFPTTQLTDFDNHSRIDDEVATERAGGSTTAAQYEASILAMFTGAGGPFRIVSGGIREVVGPATADANRVLTLPQSDRLTLTIDGETDPVVLVSPFPDREPGTGDLPGTIDIVFFAHVISRPSGYSQIVPSTVTAVAVAVIDPEDGVLMRRAGKTVTESIAAATYTEKPEDLFRWLKGRAATRGKNADGDTVWSYADSLSVTLTLPQAGGAVFTARENARVLGVKRISATGNLSYTES